MSGWDLIAAELATGHSVALKHGSFMLAENHLPYFIPSEDFLQRTLGARSRLTSAEYDIEGVVAPVVSLPIVDEFEELIFALLVEQPVVVENFGRFTVRDVRQVTDVGDGPLKQIIAFQPSRELRELLNPTPT